MIEDAVRDVGTGTLLDRDQIVLFVLNSFVSGAMTHCGTSRRQSRRNGRECCVVSRAHSSHTFGYPAQMTFLQLLPVGLSAIVLAAHFLRAGIFPLVVVSLSLVALLFVRQPWAARAIQIGLLLGTSEWLRTLIVLVSFRMQSHEPFTRLAIIIGSVAAVTASSALMVQTQTLRRHFRLAVSEPS